MRVFIGFPIVAKMIVISVALLLSVAIPIAFKSSELFETMSTRRESDANLDQARARASEVENIFFGYIDRVKLISAMILKSAETEVSEFGLAEDLDLVALEIIELKDHRRQLRKKIIKQSFLQDNNLTQEKFEASLNSQRISVDRIFSGQVQLANSSLPTGPALLSLGIPLVKTDEGTVTVVAIADIKLDRIQKSFLEKGVRRTFLVDSEGRAIGHSHDDWVLTKKDLRHLEIVQKSLESSLREGQTRYFDPESNEWYVGAYSRTALGLNVIAQASEKIIKEPAMALKREAYRIAGWVLSGALFLIFLFSMSLTGPLERLLEITYEIGKGNFNVKNDVRSLDEVGALAGAIRGMVNGLKERDKAKEVLRKFHGSVAEEMMKSDLNLGGTRKDITVFFSDLRDFTKFSEGHTPEEVLNMLNEYFQIMVSIVNRNKGVVDKFVGDAMMVIWGAPHSTGDDTYWAVKAAIEMRQALAELNQARAKRGKIPIKMGMGIHCGEAISGQMGSTERMEYTVIGDTVNQASRIESSTKAFGVDLLISQEVFDRVKDKFLIESVGEVQVKGKSDYLALFKVRGYLGKNGEPFIVSTPFSDYPPSHDDKVHKAS